MGTFSRGHTNQGVLPECICDETATPEKRGTTHPTRNDYHERGEISRNMAVNPHDEPSAD
jgi:hypothetical protein